MFRLLKLKFGGQSQKWAEFERNFRMYEGGVRPETITFDQFLYFIFLFGTFETGIGLDKYLKGHFWVIITHQSDIKSASESVKLASESVILTLDSLIIIREPRERRHPILVSFSLASGCCENDKGMRCQGEILGGANILSWQNKIYIKCIFISTDQTKT